MYLLTHFLQGEVFLGSELAVVVVKRMASTKLSMMKERRLSMLMYAA